MHTRVLGQAHRNAYNAPYWERIQRMQVCKHIECWIKCLTWCYTYICNHLQLSVLNCYYESEVSRLHHSCLTFVQVYFALHIKVNAVSLNHDLFTLQHEIRKLQQSTHLRDVLCGSWASTSKLMLQWTYSNFFPKIYLEWKKRLSSFRSGIPWNTLSPMKNLQGSERDVGNTFSYHSGGPIQQWYPTTWLWNVLHTSPASRWLELTDSKITRL